MERPWCRFRREARARERRRLPQVVDSLKVLDQNRPFREADIRQTGWIVRVVPTADIKPCYSITSSARSSSEIGLESVVI